MRFPQPHAAVMLLLALTTAEPALATITVWLDPPTSTVPQNSTFNVNIVADMPEPVIAWGMDLTFEDPGIVSLAEPPTVGPTWIPTQAADGDGLAALAFPESVSGTSVVLATVSLTADALGETDLVLGITSGDPTEGFGLDPAGFAAVTFEIGHVSVVPEPSTCWFVALAASAVCRRSSRGRGW